MKRFRAFFTLPLFYLLLPTLAFSQGALTPPGAPGPTMKSLDDIDTHVGQAGEKRIPIDAAHTPGDGTNSFIITQPGSYYLTGNVTGTSGKNGIRISSDNVSVDLNGFALIGVSGSIDGMVSGNKNLNVRNGTVRSWVGGTGIDMPSTTNCIFEGVRVSDSGNHGLYAGNNSVVKDCVMQGNGITGILCANACLIRHCTSNSNGGLGINTGNDCNVIGCVTNNNASYGTFLPSKGLIKDCVASGNGQAGIDSDSGPVVIGCSLESNANGGILVGSSAVIKDCQVYGTTNGGDGIQFVSNCLVTGNVSNSNTGNGFAVRATGSLNRIDGNTAVSNTKAGILWINDLVVRNSCYVNNPNYSPSSGTAMGPIQAASTATNPWGNF